MSSFFPFINPPPSEINNDPLPMFREVAWDFDNDFPIIENGDFKEIEGIEAIKVWCYKAIKTNRYEHSIYSWDYGCEISELIGRGYTKGLIEAETERYIKEALLINKYIIDVSVTDITFDETLLTVTVKIETIYGEGEVKI